MKILVCVKQVPDTEAKLKIKADGSGIEEQGIKWVVNPYDEFAIEEAIKIKEANAGTLVTILSLGPKKRVVDSIRTGLAMGGDDGIVIDTDETMDSLKTASAIAKAIEQEGPYDIIFAGKLAIDDNESAVPQMIAGKLDIPHVSVVSKVEVSGNKLSIERDIEGGSKELFECETPCVISANKGLNMPRYASLPGIMKAKKKPMKEIAISDLTIEDPSIRVTPNQFKPPAEKPAIRMLDGEPDAQVKSLIEALRNEAKVL